MSTFKGFELIKVIRAITTTSPGVDSDQTHSYEVEIHGMTGKYTDSAVMTIQELKSRCGPEFGMTKCRYALLQCGEIVPLMYSEYLNRVKEWEAR